MSRSELDAEAALSPQTLLLVTVYMVCGDTVVMAVPTFTRYFSRRQVGVGSVVIGLLLLVATVVFSYSLTIIGCAPDYWTLAGVRLPVIRYSGIKLITAIPRVYWDNGCNTYATILYFPLGAVISFAIGWSLISSPETTREESV